MTVSVELQDELIAAWTAWEHVASHPPRHPSAMWLAAEVARKEAALHALGLDPCQAHETIAAWRKKHYDVPSAVQACINQLAPASAAPQTAPTTSVPLTEPTTGGHAIAEVA